MVGPAVASYNGVAMSPSPSPPQQQSKPKPPPSPPPAPSPPPSPSPPLGPTPCTSACDSCSAVPGNAAWATDDHCAPCATGQPWWPCDFVPNPCKCDAKPTPSPSPLPPSLLTPPAPPPPSPSTPAGGCVDQPLPGAWSSTSCAALGAMWCPGWPASSMCGYCDHDDIAQSCCTCKGEGSSDTSPPPPAASPAPLPPPPVIREPLPSPPPPPVPPSRLPSSPVIVEPLPSPSPPSPPPLPSPPPTAAAPLPTPSPSPPRPPPASSVSGPRVTQYFASWGIYSYSNPSGTSSRQAFFPWQMHLASITHINYAFLDVDASCSVVSMDTWADFDISFAGRPVCSGAVTASCVPQSVKNCAYGGNVGALRCLRDVDHPHLKLVFSLGGWTKSKFFSGCAADADKRAALVASAVDLLTEHDFDGIDVDWEYPACCGESDNQVDGNDWANYVLLLRELRAAMDERSPSKHKELTIAMGMNPRVSGVAPRAELGEVLDAINLMSYDYNGAWLPFVAHNAPLFEDPDGTAAGGAPEFNIDWGVQLVARATCRRASSCSACPPTAARWTGAPHQE